MGNLSTFPQIFCEPKITLKNIKSYKNILPNLQLNLFSEVVLEKKMFINIRNRKGKACLALRGKYKVKYHCRIWLN